MKWIKLALITTASGLLVACGQKLTTDSETAKVNGMVAVIKGETSAKTVSYQAATKSGAVKAQSGTYVVTLPLSQAKQTVTLKADGKQQQVTVKAQKPVADYATVQKQFNQAIVAMALPKDVQAQLKQQPKAPTGQLTPQQKMAMAKQQQALGAAMAKAKAATADQQLPETTSGLKQVLATDGGKVRMNVQAGKVIGVTNIVPMSAMKNKKQQQAFGQQLGLLANALGADAKKVGEAFSKATEDKDSKSTTIDTITSKGIKFNVGVSMTDLYVYITR